MAFTVTNRAKDSVERVESGKSHDKNKEEVGKTVPKQITIKH